MPRLVGWGRWPWGRSGKVAVDGVDGARLPAGGRWILVRRARLPRNRAELASRVCFVNPAELTTQLAGIDADIVAVQGWTW